MPFLSATKSKQKMDSLKLELLKNKKENAQSAIASQEVREHLAGFIRSKLQGSSSQINNIQQQTGSNQLSGGSACSSAAGQTGVGREIYDNKLPPDHGGTGIDEDHPLRKTASMPTMHIPYKAKSLSCRRKMERRTTMSPLMRRPKRQLLHSRDSNSTEYSSNPCIIQSSRTNTRSLSQSNSPPPSSSVSTSQHQLALAASSVATDIAAPVSHSAPDTSQAIKLSSIYTDRELENLQDNLKSTSSYFAHNNQLKHSTTTSNVNQNLNKSTQSVDNATHRQQHYMKVTESIRKSVIQRANNRGKMATGGSLDIDQCGGRKSGLTKGDAGSGGRLNTLTDYKDELRQWSLDGADLRASSALNKLAFASGIGASHLEFHRLRLATTTDAAGLRSSQSPNSSISMGIPPGPAAAVLVNQQQMLATKPSQGVLNHLKQYSSSSSSTSSLLSAQNSLEDSSPQAIDLSNSSEFGRQRHQAPNCIGLSPTVAGHRGQLTSHLLRGCAPNTNHEQQQCQKALQDLFNKLQLRQSQENIKQMQYLPQHQQHYQAIQGGDQHIAFSNATKTAASFDASRLASTNLVANHLADHLNLSDSAQNLISLQEQQQQQLHQMIGSRGISPMLCHESTNQQQPQDLNQWLMVYNNLIQSAELQQSSQISSPLLAKIIGLPEPYKTSLLAHLMQRQQRFQALNSVPQPLGVQPNNVHCLVREQQDQRSLIGRTLSSPLLLNSGSSGDVVSRHSFNTTAQLKPSLASSRQQITQTDDMMIDSVEDMMMISINARQQSTMDLDKQSVQAFPPMMIDASAHSLDLTTSTSRSSSSNEATKNNKSGWTQQMHPKQALDFSYTPPADHGLAKFIYNPVFDQASSTGLTYELNMCKHKCICGNESNHPENSQRVLAIWQRLHERGLLARCAKIEARRASIEELKLCHR